MDYFEKVFGSDISGTKVDIGIEIIDASRCERRKKGLD